MGEVTQILNAIDRGDSQAAERLLPLVYNELRRLAAQKMAQEKPGQTLQATALVHEAYLRLVGADNVRTWDSRGHFFSAAAEAMRRILVDQARSKGSVKRGRGHTRKRLDAGAFAAPEIGPDILALHEALDLLGARDRQAAELVNLRFFAGLTSQQAADTLGVSTRTVDRMWHYARSFLLQELSKNRE